MISDLETLSENLKIFRPDLTHHFVCPTCLTPLTTDEIGKNITQAHIIPRAAGGTVCSLLCKKCNNLFGSKQDKWFGELIKVSKKGAVRLLSSDIKDGYFWIDNVRVNGTWKQAPDRSLKFYIDKMRNPPKVNQLVLTKFSRRPPSVQLQVSFPILRNKRLAEIGSLTAGYLMWFAALGYSWVFQKHLDPIREQILNPNKELLDGRFIAHLKGIEWTDPWIGVITIRGELIPAMGFLSHFVLFPPRDCPGLYRKLGDDLTGLAIDEMRRIDFSLDLRAGVAVGIMVEQRLLVAPDAILQGQDAPPNALIFFPPGSTRHQFLVPITEEEAKKVQNHPNTQSIRLRLKE